MGVWASQDEEAEQPFRRRQQGSACWTARARRRRFQSLDVKPPHPFARTGGMTAEEELWTR